MSKQNYIVWIKKLTALLGVGGVVTLLGLPALGQINPNLGIFNKSSPNSRDRLAQATPVAAKPRPGTHLRYLAINVGNLTSSGINPSNPKYWQFKIGDPTVVNNVRAYIAEWKPDVIMLSEVFAQQQLKGPIPGVDPADASANAGKSVPGPILPEGYDGICGKSEFPNGTPASPYAPGASHEHECIAWKTSRVSLAPGTVPGSPKSAYGSVADSSCNYDFTGFRVKLLLNGNIPFTAVAVHPQSGPGDNTCRIQEIGRYWQVLASEKNVIIGGDWNTDDPAQLQVPANFKINYSFGNHWERTTGKKNFIATHPDEYTNTFAGAQKKFDHAFSNFGSPCRTCGKFYGTPNLIWGSAVGDAPLDNHPRADGNSGMDHRQILVDMEIPRIDLAFVIDTTGSMWDDIDKVKASATEIVNSVIGPDSRIALTDYKDFGDYTYRADLPFTDDEATINKAIQSLSVGGGGDFPESVYSGLMRTIQAEGIDPWRKDANKVIILIGDAPPHDPEQNTGYTLNTVVEAAKAGGVSTSLTASTRTEGVLSAALSHKIVKPVFSNSLSDLNSFTKFLKPSYWLGSHMPKQITPNLVQTSDFSEPITIYSIVIGSDPSAYNYFSKLATGTGGKVFTAPTAADVVPAILEIVEDLAKPPANQPPNVDGAVASIAQLWPPNHKMQNVKVLNVTDPNGDPVSITITGITQDEPVKGSGSGNESPDGSGIGTDTASVRAERTGQENGRVYKISFTASDGKEGGQSSGSVMVCVPHDQGANIACSDDGQNYNSTTP